MKLRTVDKKWEIGMDITLLLRLKMAMDIFHETAQTLIKEKCIEGTVDDITTRLFNGATFFIKDVGLDVTPELVVMSKVVVGSFGVTIYLKDRNEDIIISYDSIKLKLKD